MFSDKHAFFTFYSTINLPDIGLCIILASMYKDNIKIDLFIYKIIFPTNAPFIKT